MTYTHAGWFWFVPVLAAMEGQGVAIEARWRWLEPLLSVCDALESLRIRVSMWLWPDYEPTFMFLLRELERPVQR